MSLDSRKVSSSDFLEEVTTADYTLVILASIKALRLQNMVMHEDELNSLIPTSEDDTHSDSSSN